MCARSTAASVRSPDRPVARRRPALHEQLAGCGHDAVPQREELELGRGLPGARHGPLAGEDQAGQRVQRNSARLDWLPTILAVAGDTQVTDKLLKGYQVGGMTYKIHLDGYNLVPYLTGQVAKSPRDSFL